jgi:HEAT repeat protein
LHAAWALANLAGREPGGPDDNEQFSDLVKLIHDSDASVRYWGAIGLTNFGQRLKAGDGGRSGVINALQPLLEDKSAAPRIAAAAGLGKLGQADKVLPILVAAMSDPQDATRIQAVAAIESLGAAAAPAEATLTAAQTDASEYVKRISARALEKLNAAGRAK